ncbi:MAG: molybdopterin-guanine dinucleotide biosynthesis protein B [Desulfobacteraceae bacterium]|nr:molybdopterin-guanine dinucleotide biosynthesis protein B [Desulfobacteraceae bacterium]
MKLNIVSIVGKSGSGKTTLIEKIIKKLKEKEYIVGTVKHTHKGFHMDKKGKDSWRHRNAGANATLVIAPGLVALVKDEELELLEEIQHYLSDMDIVLVEGFKKKQLPKIEIFRNADRHEAPLCMNDENLDAFVTDSDYAPDVPKFGLEDIEGITEFIEKQYLKV